MRSDPFVGPSERVRRDLSNDEAVNNKVKSFAANEPAIGTL